MTEIKTIQNKEIKLKGVLTSQIQLRGENANDHYYYAFVKLKGQSVDLPVIFKVEKKSCQYCAIVAQKCNRSDCGFLSETKLVKPILKKGDPVELFGHYSNSAQSIRKSFTCLDYIKIAKFKSCLGCKRELLSSRSYGYNYCATCLMPKKRVSCGDKFACFTNEDYDYCRNCEVNNSRYIREGNFLVNKDE